jgi:hypothetical protein
MLMQRRLLIPVLLGSLVGAPLGLSPVRAEMLQFSSPDGGVKSWPKLPDIPDWHQDQELSMKLSANFLVPDGADPATSEVTIQARGFPRSGDTSSLSQLMDKDRAAASPTTQVIKRADLYDKDGTPFTLVSFAPATGSNGMWKATAYSEEGEYLLAFTLQARSQAAYDKNLPVFTTLVRRYARDIPW